MRAYVHVVYYIRTCLYVVFVKHNANMVDMVYLSLCYLNREYYNQENYYKNIMLIFLSVIV